MQFVEEKRIEECPAKYANVVERIQNGEQNFYQLVKINPEIQEFLPKDHFDHLVSWMLLASVYYRNFGMLQNILAGLKELEAKLPVQQNSQTEKRPRAQKTLAELLCSLSIGGDDSKKQKKGEQGKQKPRQNKRFKATERAWYSYEKNILFWSIMIANDYDMTALLIANGAKLNWEGKDSEYDKRRPFNPAFLFKYAVNDKIDSSFKDKKSIFELSKVDTMTFLRQKNPAFQDIKKIVEWLEQRYRIILLLFKHYYNDPYYQEIFYDFTTTIHPDHKKLFYNLRNCMNLNFKNEAYSYRSHEAEAQKIFAELKFWSAIKENIILLKKLWHVMHILFSQQAPVELVVIIKQLADLNPKVGANVPFFITLGQNKDLWLHELQSPNFIKTIGYIMTKLNMPMPDLTEKELTDCIKLLISLPNDVMARKALYICASGLQEAIGKIGCTRLEFKQYLFELLVNNTGTMEKNVSENLSRQNFLIMFFLQLERYWTSLVKTFFFTRSANPKLTDNVATGQSGKSVPWLSLPQDLVKIIASFLRPGQINLSSPLFSRQEVSAEGRVKPRKLLTAKRSNKSDIANDSSKNVVGPDKKEQLQTSSYHYLQQNLSKLLVEENPPEQALPATNTAESSSRWDTTSDQMSVETVNAPLDLKLQATEEVESVVDAELAREYRSGL